MDGQNPYMMSQLSVSPTWARRRFVEGSIQPRNNSRHRNQSSNRGRIRNRGEALYHNRYRNRQTLERFEDYSNTCYRLHGEANDASFSYKHDHFQDFQSSSDDKSCSYLYHSYSHNRQYSITQKQCKPHKPSSSYNELSWVIHKPKHESIVDSRQGEIVEMKASGSIESRHDEAEVSKQLYFSQEGYWDCREEESRFMSTAAENIDSDGVANFTEGHYIEEESNSSTFKKYTSFVDTLGTHDKSTICNGYEKVENHFDIESKSTRLENRSLEIDEAAIKAEAAEEVAFIVALSKSNHCSVKLNADVLTDTPTSCETTNDDSLRKVDESRHDRLLQQQEQNQQEQNEENIDELKSKPSLHSVSLGKDFSHPIDITENFDNVQKQNDDDENNQSQNRSRRSDDELEAALYRHMETVIGEGRDEAEAIREPNHYSRDRRFGDFSSRNSGVREARDEFEMDPRTNAIPAHNEYERHELEPRIQPFRTTDADTIGRPCLPKRDEKVQNILIDLIRHEKFNFALQRIHYFPQEAFETVSSINENLALHETLEKMIVSGHYKRDDQNFHPQNDCNNNDQDVSQILAKFAMLLLETNPSALSTPGNGGYLPLHMACSSSFPDVGFERRLALIRAMLVMHSEGAKHQENETGELPLHRAIRWICNQRRNSESTNDQEDETIVCFLLMVHPGGATTQDKSGSTPCDILYQQQPDDWPIFQRLGRCLLFASQLSQSSPNENVRFHNMLESDIVLDFPPIDHIEFADTMSGTEILGEKPETSKYDHSPTNPTRSLSENDTMKRGKKLREQTWSDASRCTKQSCPEKVEKDYDNTKKRRNKRGNSKITRKWDEWESNFADQLLNELLDAADE